MDLHLHVVPLGKEAGLPRALLSTKSPESIFFIFVYISSFNKTYFTNITHHPHHIYHKYVIHLNTCPSQSAKFISHKFMSQSANT